MNVKEKFWMWGYTQEQTGISVPFTGITRSYCSLESAADYYGMPNAVFMNSMHTWERVEENLALLKDSRQLLCALPHGAANAVEGAGSISRLSLVFPQIRGIVMDDFLQLSGHPTTPELVRDIKKQLHSANPGLELYVVMYSDINHLDVTPYLEYIDGFMLWRWVSAETFWRAELPALLHRFKANYGKKVLHGVYLQNYGENGSTAAPMDLELWKLQWMCLLKHLRSESGFLDGCVLLQNAWVGDLRFRDQAVWLKETLDWFFATTSIR